jgi:hypothetical protein
MKKPRKCLRAHDRVESLLLHHRLSSAQRDEAHSIALAAKRCLQRTKARWL